MDARMIALFVLVVVSVHTQTIDEVLTDTMTRDHVPVKPVLEEEGGDVLVDLDEELTPEQFRALFTNTQKGTKVTRAAGIKFKVNHWTDGVVPYTVDETFQGEHMKRLQSIFDLIHKDTCVKFVPRKEQKNYIAFHNGRACWSKIGMVGKGVQGLGLEIKGCRNVGTIYHEIMHALGIIHEQERPDRDQHISVDYDAMTGRGRSQFRKANQEWINNYNVPYDFSSLMHYGLTFFSKDGRRQTMHALNEPHAKAYLGSVWHKGPSYGDVKLINRMYECDKRCSGVACPEPSFVNQHCRCVTQKDYFKEHCRGDETTDWCFKYRVENGLA